MNTSPNIRMCIELRPITVPNYIIQKVTATLQEGFIASPKYHISELSENILNMLCDQFRENLLAKAKKGLPEVSSDE